MGDTAIPNFSNLNAYNPQQQSKQVPLTLSPEQLERISRAESFRELSSIRQELLDATPLRTLTRAGELAPFAIVVNLIHDSIIRHSVLLSVGELAKRGVGTPPVPFAFLQFGSGGRHEQALISDQDNGLVYQLPDHLDQAQAEKVHSYFHLLGATIVQGLEEAGYPPCQGNVTCVSQRWRGSVEQWIDRLDGLASHPIWENARYLLLASDARVLWGESAIFQPVLDHFRRLLADNAFLMSRLASNTLHYRVPLGLFGRILPEVNGRFRGAINLKYGVYLPIVNCIRHFALANGIFCSSTLERLSLLREKGIWEKSFCDDLENHFRQVLGLRLVAPLHWEDGQYTSNSYIKLRELSSDTTVMARGAMKLAIRLQRMTAKLPSVSKG
ncbi:histidine kinase [Brevibacillus choshinensis]|uniref:Histidine kinase n=2 Tax=Brevibacillus choshinensis TaxID=54911 RepID=A0ABX7FXA3_BRECH|nr:histidine kinase [Brevibacillus choshinensis]